MAKSIGFTDEIRAAVRASGYGLREVCRGTGIDPGAFSRFLNGERGLSMASLDKLAAFLGLHVTAPEGTKSATGKRTKTKRPATKRAATKGNAKGKG